MSAYCHNLSNVPVIILYNLHVNYVTCNISHINEINHAMNRNAQVKTINECLYNIFQLILSCCIKRHLFIGVSFTKACVLLLVSVVC